MEKDFNSVGEFVKFSFELFNISLHQAIYYYESLNDLPRFEDNDFWDLDDDYLLENYPNLAKVAAFFFGVSEQSVLSQDEHITDRFLEDKKISSFFTTAWAIEDRIRGAYFKGNIGKNIGGLLTGGMPLNKAMSTGFVPRYDYESIPRRLLSELKEGNKSVPGLYHAGQRFLDLSIQTEHFVSCDPKDFLEAFLYIVKRLESLFHKALTTDLSEMERQEYDFYILALNIRMVIVGSKHAFYRNIILFRDFYRDHPYNNLTSYLRFDFWHEDFYQPWRCIEFIKYHDLAQRFFDYVPEAKQVMRQFSMDVRYFKCTYTWSDAPHFTASPEEEAWDKRFSEANGLEYIPPEQRRRVPETYYIEKNEIELEDDYRFAKALSLLSSPPRQGGILVTNPEGRVYAEDNWTKVLLKYYKGGLV